MAEELTEAQETELLEALDTLVAELANHLEETREEVKPVDLDLPIGRVSRMDAMQQQSMARANREGLSRRLALCRAALSRAAEGEYGYCLDCGDPIGHRRLTARPETPFCSCGNQERP